MKKVAFILFILVLSKAASAQYKPVDQGSSLKFKIENFGFDVTGSFTGIQGTINFDPKEQATSSFDVTIDAGTVNTDNSLRDEHLRGESYFDVKNYSRIHFVSKKITTAKGNDTYTVTGQLTIKGKTKDISFPFTVLKADDGFVFKGSFKINRRDFGIGGASTISDELEVLLNVQAKKI